MSRRQSPQVQMFASFVLLLVLRKLVLKVFSAKAFMCKVVAVGMIITLWRQAKLRQRPHLSG